MSWLGRGWRAWVALMDRREPATALTLAEKAVTMSGGTDADGLDVLAQAYFQNGRVSHAVNTEQRALALLSPRGPDQKEQPTRRRIESHLTSFRAHGGRAG